MHYVYVLHCADGNLYIGYSGCLKDRVMCHHNGSVRSTRERRPVRLVYYECYLDGRDARSREINLKSGAGHDQLRRQHGNLFQRLGYGHGLSVRNRKILT